MRSPTALILVAALALAQGALAAGSPKAVNAPAKAINAAAKPAPLTPEAQKRAACERTWKAQTKHTGKHKAFVAACVAKG
ncbi:MAG TPA: hypothetical protein VFN88_08195 [Caulobacteraceae bacterium]|nr:hypothetical protein [Caulobacteraceae bacterium]